ncbi:MAG TPA: ROK family protein, partial [Candidatus Sulfotelmatobacter sp.]|nr:ROK family protein [Candidatus Sulfotelmatobacter sp.]
MGKQKYVIGIDIGGTKIMAVLFDSRFQILARSRTKTKANEGEKHFHKILRDEVLQILKEAKVDRDDVVGIGLGCPGIIDEKRGVVRSSPNIRFLKNYPLTQRITRSTRLPALAANDVNAGLFGEQQFGAAKRCANVIGVFIGTGIGGAIIADGRMVSGAFGAAGEFGHIQATSVGPLCGCGKRGCLEAVASRLAIATEAAGLTARQMAPALFRKAGTDVKDIRSGTIAKAIRSGDRALEGLVREKGRIIGSTLGALVSALNPEKIVLGGGLAEALARYLIPEVDQAMRQTAMPALSKSVKVVAAKLGDYATAMGAAKMAWDRFYVPPMTRKENRRA